MTIRFRPEVAERLKRATFDRRLAGKKANTTQDNVNEAVEARLGRAADRSS